MWDMQLLVIYCYVARAAKTRGFKQQEMHLGVRGEGFGCRPACGHQLFGLYHTVFQ